MKEISIEYRVYLYEEIREISKDKVYIVINRLDNKIYIKKILDKGYEKIYNRLKIKKNKFRVEIIELIVYEEKLIVIEEYINGWTLMELLERRNFNEKEGIELISNICDGLIDLHSDVEEIIHRDIKPENIMINNDGIVKIIDFDISRIVNLEKGEDTTLLGTKNYASPEQFGFAQTDKRSDIYSIGVLLNYILVKKLPKDELYEGSLKYVIKKATEMDREKRYSNLQEVKEDLKRWTDIDELKVKDRKTLKSKIWIKKIVGFRSGELINSLIAIVWYFISICMLWGYIFYNQIADLGFAIYLIIIPEILIGEFFGFGRHIPFYNSENKKEKVILRIFVGTIMTIIILWIFNMVYMI